MNPLDSTTILAQAVQRVLEPSSIGPAGARRAELKSAEASGGARTNPSTGEAERSIGHSRTARPASSPQDRQGSYSRNAGIRPYANTEIDNPRATLKKAEELLEIAATDESPAALRRRIATAAYLMEIEATRELAKIRREGPARIREWFA